MDYRLDGRVLKTFEVRCVELLPLEGTEETLSHHANGSNAKPMAPTCAEFSERAAPTQECWSPLFTCLVAGFVPEGVACSFVY